MTCFVWLPSLSINVFKIVPHCSMFWYLIHIFMMSNSPLNAYINTKFYLFISWWTFGSFPTFGYCEQCCCKYSCRSVWVPVFISFWYIPRNRVARSYENSVFNFLENFPDTFSQQPHHFTFPTSNAWRLQFLHISVNTCYSPFLILWSTQWIKVGSCYSFALHFPND